jgi:hypothetical protein
VGSLDGFGKLLVFFSAVAALTRETATFNSRHTVLRAAIPQAQLLPPFFSPSPSRMKAWIIESVLALLSFNKIASETSRAV